MEKEGDSSMGRVDPLFMAVEGAGRARHWIFDGGESAAVGVAADRLNPRGDSGEATDGDMSIAGEALVGAKSVSEPEALKLGSKFRRCTSSLMATCRRLPKPRTFMIANSPI